MGGSYEVWALQQGWEGGRESFDCAASPRSPPRAGLYCFSLRIPCFGPATKLDKIFVMARLKSFLSGRSKLFTAITEFKRNCVSETDFFVSKNCSKTCS